ncbi:acyltransferase [Priestia megaterium]|uniref:acyltransferase n=1 Tax=Priestia megaterium TaxID=1404 RepID=UPI002E251D33|nr:acyltransferase [Priestia megaterium]
MKLFKMLVALFKSVYFNFKVFPIKTAIKLPVIVSHNIKLYNLHAQTVLIESQPTFGMIKFGWSQGSTGISGRSEACKWSVDKNSKVIFKGRANLANGISVRCDNGGTIVFGENFICNSNCFFASNKRIEFGKDVLIGWNTNIRDVDGHKVYNANEREGNILNPPKEIIIGSNVWVAAHVDILKGVIIGDGCVVAYRACVTRRFDEKNCIIGGFPAEVIKTNICWER